MRLWVLYWNLLIANYNATYESVNTAGKKHSNCCEEGGVVEKTVQISTVPAADEGVGLRERGNLRTYSPLYMYRLI